MVDRNHRIRFAYNNFAVATSTTQTYSSTKDPYPATNLETESRYEYWKPTGCFTIDSTNNKLYIDEGGGTLTATLTSGNYVGTLTHTYGGDALAAEIETQLNAVGAFTYTCYYAAYRFNITSSSSTTLKRSNQTNAAWNTIGITLTTDATGTSFSAQESRIHTAEYAVYDMGTAMEATFFALIHPLKYALELSTNATVKVQANSILSWTSPALNITVDRTNEGYFRFLDDQTSTNYRYWRIYIEDRENADFLTDGRLSHIYLGNYTTVSDRNVANGFNKQLMDKSEVMVSDGGSKFFRTKPKVTQITNMSLPYLSQSNHEALQQMFYDIGISTPFYISLDPTNIIASDHSYLTKYVRFSDAPVLQHIVHDVYTMNFSVEEVI